MVLEDVLEDEIRGEHEGDAHDESRQRKPQEAVFLPEGTDSQERKDQETEPQQDVQGLDFQEEGPPVGLAFPGHRNPGHPFHPVQMVLDRPLQHSPQPGQGGHKRNETDAGSDPLPELLARTHEGVAQGQDADEDEDGRIGTDGQRRDEEQDHQADEPEPPAGETFPVQDEDKAGIDEGGPRLALRHDDEHGHGDDGGHEKEILPLGDLEVLPTHDRRQEERCRNLRYFSRLELDRT